MKNSYLFGLMIVVMFFRWYIFVVVLLNRLVLVGLYFILWGEIYWMIFMFMVFLIKFFSFWRFNLIVGLFWWILKGNEVLVIKIFIVILFFCVKIRVSNIRK